MNLNPTQAALRQIKEASSLSWAQIADVLGASSGDYVRKVAAGAKPGANLAPNVAELLTKGEVSKAVPRRTTAAGTVARVRASARTGATSRTPGQTAVVASENTRRLYRLPSGRLGWSQTTGRVDRVDGVAAFRRQVQSAGRGRHRVQLRVKVRGNVWVTVGGKGGYRGRDILDGIRKAGGVEPWLATQLAGRTYAHTAGGDLDVLDVEVIAE